MRRAARPSCPRADRSPGDDGWVAHLLAAVHPAHVPIPRCERASMDWSVRLAHARCLTVALARLRVKRSDQLSRRAPDSASVDHHNPVERHAPWGTGTGCLPPGPCSLRRPYRRRPWSSPSTCPPSDAIGRPSRLRDSPGQGQILVPVVRPRGPCSYRVRAPRDHAVPEALNLDRRLSNSARRGGEPPASASSAASSPPATRAAASTPGWGAGRGRAGARAPAAWRSTCSSAPQPTDARRCP